MKPYKLNEVLQSNYQGDWFMTNIPNVPVIFSDNFLIDHTKLKNLLVDAPASSMQNRRGGNFVDYYDCRQYLGYENLTFHDEIRKVIFRHYGVMTKLNGDIYTNWFLQIKKRPSDISIPHTDHVQHSIQFTILTYLNDENECCGGTAFFKHKKSQKISLYHQDKELFFSLYPELIEDGANYWLEKNLPEWELLGFVEMRPRRVIIFPSEFFHSAYHTDDKYFQVPRLTLVYSETIIN